MLHRNWLAGPQQWSSVQRSRVAQGRKPQRLSSVAIEELESNFCLSAAADDHRSPADSQLAERHSSSVDSGCDVQTLDHGSTNFANSSLDLRAASRSGVGITGTLACHVQ